MVQTHWEELRDREVRYLDHTWRLTGDVEVREQGERLALDARQIDEVRHTRGALCFSIDDTADSLNPGDMGEHFDRIEPDGNGYSLVVKQSPRTYRYVLRRLERR